MPHSPPRSRMRRQTCTRTRRKWSQALNNVRTLSLTLRQDAIALLKNPGDSAKAQDLVKVATEAYQGDGASGTNASQGSLPERLCPGAADGDAHPRSQRLTCASVELAVQQMRWAAAFFATECPHTDFA